MDKLSRPTFLPCPVCGSMPYIREAVWEYNTNIPIFKPAFWIECCGFEFGPHRTIEELAAAWNWKELRR